MQDNQRSVKGLTNVGKLAILENEEFVLFAQGLQSFDDGWVVVFQDVNMGLFVRPVSNVLAIKE